MRVIATVLACTLTCTPIAAAGSESDGGLSIQQSAARAVAREVSQAAQQGSASLGGNPFAVSGLMMVAGGVVISIAAATLPQVKTQTDDYDICAIAQGGLTGPSAYRTPACDDYRTTNKPLFWFGIGSAVAGSTLFTVGALRSLSIRATPTRFVVETRKVF